MPTTDWLPTAQDAACPWEKGSAPEAADGIAERLRTIEARIAEALRMSGRPEGDVTLIAVSKFQSLSAIEAVMAAGHRTFGESRVQEADQKWKDLERRRPGIELHMIGRLQSNKAQAAVRLFDVIQTVDRSDLALVLGSEMRRTGRRPSCLVQVNTGRERQKGGVLPEAADRLIEECITEHDLPVTGVMGIPPDGEDPEPHFALLQRIALRNRLEVISMGMSRDFERAITLGATHVRIGTALFGGRRVRHASGSSGAEPSAEAGFRRHRDRESAV